MSNVQAQGLGFYPLYWGHDSWPTFYKVGMAYSATSLVISE